MDKALNCRFSDLGEDWGRVEEYLRMVPASDFLSGRGEPSMLVSLEWLSGPKNFAKVINGNFSRNRRPAMSASELRLAELAREDGDAE